MPKVNEVHEDAALTNMAINYRPEGFVAEKAFPVVNVKKESDVYYIWARDEKLRRENSLRADGTASKTISYDLTTDNYQAEEYALNAKVTDRQKANADSVLNLRTNKMKAVQDQLLLDYEGRVATIVNNAANYAAANTTTLAGNNQWDSANFATLGGDTIEGYLDVGKTAIRDACGFSPNHIFIPDKVAKVMKKDSVIRELIRYTQSDLLVNGDLPPTIFNMKVVIPGAINTTSAPGAAADTFADVWDQENVAMLYVTSSPATQNPTFGYTLRQRKFKVKAWREEKESSEYIEPSFVQDEKLVNAGCGYLIVDSVS